MILCPLDEIIYICLFLWCPPFRRWFYRKFPTWTVRIESYLPKWLKIKK